VNRGEGRLGARRVGDGAGDECGEEGRASHPFIGPEGGAGWPDGEGDRAAGGGDINAGRPVRWGGETEGRVGSEEGGATLFPGEEGTPGWCARLLAVAPTAAPAVSRGGRSWAGPTRQWRQLGRPEAKARWGGRPVAGPGEKEAAQERRRGVGRWQITRAERKKEGGRAEIVGRAEIQGSKRKINLMYFFGLK
jgi:hypothetical protein